MKSGKTSGRANKIMAAVGTLSVSLGMTVSTLPIDGAGPAKAATTQGSVKYNAGVMSSHKDELQTSVKTSAQNNHKRGVQNTVKHNTFHSFYSQHSVKTTPQ